MCDSLKFNNNILENNLKKSKELKSNSENEFKVYNSKMMEEAKKENGENFDEKQQLEINRQKFGVEYSKNLTKANYGVFDEFTDKLEAAFQATLENLPAVGPFFSVFFAVFGGGGVDLKTFYKQIMDAVEKLVEKALAEEVKRQCQMHFENLQGACVIHKSNTQLWYDVNGITSNSSNGIKPQSDIEGLILASFNDMRIKFSDSLTYFSEPNYIGYTVTHYIYTSALYLTFLEDTIRWGKEMKFPPELIDGTANVPSLSKVRSDFIEKSIKTINSGCVAYIKLLHDAGHTTWDWYSPVGLDVGLGITFKRFWPNNNCYLVRKGAHNQYLLKAKKGIHTIVTGDLDGEFGWIDSVFPSFYTGTFSLMPHVVQTRGVTVKILNENNFNRTMSIKIHHIIKREGTWTLKCFNNSEGEAGAINKSWNFSNYEGTHDACQKDIPTLGWNNLGTFTSNHTNIHLVCARSRSGGSFHGYAVGSQVFDIEITDQ
ncbi:hypothetical protein RB653_008697 [Dictyostelium firmibasis]|uniref:Pesticidal crystal protein N-terminal domain-containing protein n=1 Tax=Dictyostelium firmibasis TaxID=79012 RepID=A0AAN7YPI1_9MYCE